MILSTEMLLISILSVTAVGYTGKVMLDQVKVQADELASTVKMQTDEIRRFGIKEVKVEQRHQERQPESVNPVYLVP